MTSAPLTQITKKKASHKHTLAKSGLTRKAWFFFSCFFTVSSFPCNNKAAVTILQRLSVLLGSFSLSYDIGSKFT